MSACTHRILLFFLLILSPHLQGSCGKCQSLHDTVGRPSEALLQILSLFGVCHDGSWKCIQEATEKAWLSHGRGTERWELEPIKDFTPEKTYASFTSLEMTQTLFAEKMYYDYGVVLGATVQTVRQRFWFLKAEWERGVRFPILVILTGDRPLDPTVESEKALIDPTNSPYPFRAGWCWDKELPQNETEMMRLVFDQLALPEAWRAMPVLFVDTPQPSGLKRPHTEHTLHHWLAMHPTPGSLLIVSNQPFVCRQNALLRLHMPPSFEMETVGEGFSFDAFNQEQRATAVLLAELAYWIKLHLQESLRSF